MIEACARTGTRLAINHQTRMIPNTFLAERLLKEGAIGDLRAVRMVDKGGRPAGNSLMEEGARVTVCYSAQPCKRREGVIRSRDMTEDSDQSGPHTAP
jgi:hypothetical protein